MRRLELRELGGRVVYSALAESLTQLVEHATEPPIDMEDRRNADGPCDLRRRVAVLEAQRQQETVARVEPLELRPERGTEIGAAHLGLRRACVRIGDRVQL